MKLNGIFEDKELVSEIRELVNSGRSLTPMDLDWNKTKALQIIERSPTNIDDPSMEEAIILLTGRPALLVKGDSWEAPTSTIWQNRLEEGRANLEAAIRATGRVEMRNHPRQDWAGTAWLVAENIVVTNRHVAEIFASSGGDGFTFRSNFLGRRMRALIDFREEHQESEEDEFKVTEILHIEPEPGPDLAFLRIASSGNEDERLASPLTLASELEADRFVAVIGYPAADGLRNDPEVMRRIFQDIYNVKRLQPGKLTSVTGAYITHDCSTLGGNSGSPVFDFHRGEVVGLHFGGKFQTKNIAVPAPVIAARLADVV